MQLATAIGRHRAQQLEQLFEQLFYARYRTRLCGGAAEPYYRPAVRADDDHRLFYREDFFASALHEVAHWCIAGPARRCRPDFGYWYIDSGRSAAQQHAFEEAECKPQAIERLFCEAAGFTFQPSLDQHDSEECYAEREARFAARVERQFARYQANGWPERAIAFAQALRELYRGAV